MQKIALELLQRKKFWKKLVNIMKLKDIVCSLELAKRLKELGVFQGSLFYWYATDVQARVRDAAWLPEAGDEIPYSAFTSEELGILLPKFIQNEKIGRLNLHIRWYCHSAYNKHERRDVWRCSYKGFNNCETDLEWCEDESEANARAKLLIAIIEGQLIEV